MVSVSKLLEVLSRRVLEPQPMFTVRYAQVLLRCLASFSLDQRTRTDTLNMMRIVSLCPHASEVFEQQSQLCEKIMTTFFVERSMEDDDAAEALRQVIHVVSVNTNLPIPHLMTMVRRLSHRATNTNGRGKGTTAAMRRDEALADALLLRIVSTMPNGNTQIRENGSSNFLTQKEMHKRRCMFFEKPELLFLLSTLRQVTVTRAANLRDRDEGRQQVDRVLPPRVVEAVVQCVETLPFMGCDDMPLCEDDWILIAFLIACNEPQLHDLGKRIWLQRISQFDLAKMSSYEKVPFASMLLKFILGLRGYIKRDSLLLWLDIVTMPEFLSTVKAKQIYFLILDITMCARISIDGEDAAHERLLDGGLRAVRSLESISPVLAMHTRMLFTRVCPLLKTPEELTRTTKRLNEILVTRNGLEPNFIREAADFLRYVRRTALIDDQTYLAPVISLAEYLLDLLQRSPSLDEHHTAALLPAFASFSAVLRGMEAIESTPTGKEVEMDRTETYTLLKSLMEKISLSFLSHHALQAEISLVSLLLQIMELLGFASNTQYTTTVRELVISAFRAAPIKTEDVFANRAQNCYDLLLRAVHFHVLDAEVLSAAFTALRHSTDVTALRGMSWEQRTLMLERAAAVYRDIAHSFPTVKEARRLAKHLLSVAALVASEKVPSRTPRLHLEKSQEEIGRRSMRRCAQTMWTLVLRASLTSIPRTPVDRYLTPLLQFTSRHWVAADLVSGKKSHAKTNSNAVRPQVPDDELSQEIMDVMLPLLHQVMVTVFTDRAAFHANMRRNRLILETACEILYRNRDYISPFVWAKAQRILSYMPAPHTTLHTAVMRLSLKNALHHMKTCGDTSVIDPKWIADMFSSSDLIDDTELRVYLVMLAEQQLENIDTSGPVEDGEKAAEPTSEEKALLICFNKILSTLRRGSVLYY